MALGQPSRGSLGNPLARAAQSGSGTTTVTKQIRGVAAPGWLVYESATDAFALPNGISGAIGPGAATLSGPQQRTIQTIAAVTSTFPSVAYSPNGEFVVAYRDDTNGNPKFARYSATGVLQGAVTTIAAVSSAYTSVAYSPNGEFVVAYVDVTNGSNPKFAPYTQSFTGPSYIVSGICDSSSTPITQPAAPVTVVTSGVPRSTATTADFRAAGGVAITTVGVYS